MTNRSPGCVKSCSMFTGIVVVDDGSHRHRNIDGRALAARAIAAFAVPPALGLVLGIKAEMQQRVVVFAGDKNHVAAAPAVAAAGSAARDILLPPERKTAIAAVARLHADSYFINKHGSRAGFSPEAADRGGAIRSRLDADELAETAAIAKYDDAGDLRKQRVILAAADVLAGLEDGAALPHQNRPARHRFSAEALHAQPLGIGIAPVLGTA